MTSSPSRDFRDVGLLGCRTLNAPARQNSNKQSRMAISLPPSTIASGNVNASYWPVLIATPLFQSRIHYLVPNGARVIRNGDY